MAGPGPDQGGGEKNSYAVLWILFLIAVVSFGIWYLFSTELKLFFIYLRQYEFLALHSFFSLLTPLNLPWINNIESDLAVYLQFTKQLTPENLTSEAAFNTSVAAGEYLRYPLDILLIFLAYYIYKNHIQMRFLKKYNMKTLAKQEYVNWPQIKIINKIDLLAEDLDSGPWAMCMTPMQFARKNKLVLIEKAPLVGSGFSRQPGAEYKVSLNRGRAERAFSAQLGRTWNGVENMAPHRRAIFAIFAARGCRDSKAAQNLIYQLADSAPDGKINYEGADALWKKHIKSKEVERITKAHGYEFTVMASMLLLAREDGVLASADFLWVKPLDRRLWYVINNVGRQTPAAEVGGIFCHWYTELALKRPLNVPVVGAAVDALELALSEVLYIPDEAEKAEVQKREQEQHQEVGEA